MIIITHEVRKTLKAGDIIWVDLNPTAGSETQKKRPCIVVSTQPLNAVSRTIFVVPLSSGNGSIMRICPELTSSQNDCDVSGAAVVPQMRAIDPVGRCAELHGKVTDQEFMDTLKRVIAASVGIDVALLDPK